MKLVHAAQSMNAKCSFLRTANLTIPTGVKWLKRKCILGLLPFLAFSIVRIFYKMLQSNIFLLFLFIFKFTLTLCLFKSFSISLSSFNDLCIIKILAKYKWFQYSLFMFTLIFPSSFFQNLFQSIFYWIFV